jgi:hypothetical protein
LYMLTVYEVCHMSKCTNYEVEHIHTYPDIFYTRLSYHYYIFLRVYNTSLEPFRPLHRPNGNYYCSLLTGELFDFLWEICSNEDINTY